MSQVISFESYRPPARFDGDPWTDIQVYESASEDGVGTLIDTLTISPVDADPADPAERSFTTSLASDDLDLWYWVVFLDAALNESQPTTPVQNSASSVAFPAASSYAEVEELARILKIRTPSAEQTTAMERVLLMSSGEINSEIGRSNSELTGWQLALAEEVNLERAVEHWRQQESPFGLTGLSADMGPTLTARDSWERHAHKLAPLKAEWGLA